MLGVLKILILLVILVISANIGNLKAKSYENRVEELKKIKSALTVLKSKMEFTYEPIGDIFEEISKIVYNHQANIFQKSLENMVHLDVTESWNKAVEENINLNREDKATIRMFGKLLGKTDKAGQINEINVTSQMLDTLLEKAEQEKEKNYKLYRTLGVTVGIGLCILLI